MLRLRTLLFVPGNRQKLIDKACTIPADALILDLEDSVPPAEKETARELVRASVPLLALQGQAVFVRINSLSSPFAQADLRAFVIKGMDGLLIPKAEYAEDIQKLDITMEALEEERGLEPSGIKLLALVETALGVLNAREIASACERLIGVSFGAEDFTLDMGIQRTKDGDELSLARGLIALACHAADVLAIDTVYSDVKDLEGLVKETKLVRQMGFQGKLVIHPNQVEPVNQILSPSEEEVAQAWRIVEAFDAAVAQGSASIVLDGRMIDIPVAERARNTLALAEAIAQKRQP